MKTRLDNIAVVLSEPHYPENIGAAARAIKNMGLSRLIVARPGNCDLTRVLKMATYHSEDVIAEMEVHDTLEDALLPFQYVVGATARAGSHRQPATTPRQLARDLTAISQKNQTAILFGPEGHGLANEDLKFCDALVTIPTAQFSSINLAQSVMILAYEIFQADFEEKEGFVPRRASREELEGMYSQLRDTLIKIDFINPENPEYWMMTIRRFFSRIGLRGRDVRLVRGICRQIDWRCFRRDGAAPARVPEKE